MILVTRIASCAFLGKNSSCTVVEEKWDSKSKVAENRESNKNIERTGVSNKPVGPEETCSNEGGASQCNPVQDSTSQHKGSAR